MKFEIAKTGKSHGFFTATIVDCLQSDKRHFCFANDVKQGGKAIDTNGDIWVPGKFEKGTTILFEELVPDTQRKGQFAAKTIITLNEKMQIALQKISVADHSYYNHSYKPSIWEFSQLLKNKPFEGLVFQSTQIEAVEEQNETFLVTAGRTLQAAFSNLAQMGIISFDLSNPIEDEESKVKTWIKQMKEIFPEAAKNAKEEYEGFCLLRKFFLEIFQKGFVGMDKIYTHQIGPMLKEMLAKVSFPNKFDLATLKKDIEITQSTFKAIDIMNGSKMAEVQGVLSVQYLPELFMACPVWYTDIRNTKIFGNKVDYNDVKAHFASLFESDNFMIMQQLYNFEMRPFSSLVNREMPPPRTLSLIMQAKEVFDFLIILTPYLDVVDWTESKWLTVDPFLFGFYFKSPQYMYFLDRWSGNGLFPNTLEMISGTMAHLSASKEALERKDFKPTQEDKKAGLSVRPFRTIEKMEKAYKDEKLFPFLRGEYEPKK